MRNYWLDITKEAIRVTQVSQDKEKVDLDKLLIVFRPRKNSDNVLDSKVI